MLNYAQKTSLIIYNTNQVKVFKNLSYLQLYDFSVWIIGPTQPAITCSKFTTETLEQGVKYVQS